MQAWLFPGQCLLCAARLPTGTDLCEPCRQALPALGPACPRCAIPLAGGVGQACGACQRKPPPFDAVTAAFRYASPLDQLVQGLKYRRQLSLARVLGELLAARLRQHSPALPEMIVPVPLHKSRLRQRGYNQSLELARVVARVLAIPLAAHEAVVRQHPTVTQTRLSPTARARNVRNAFQARADFTGRRVAVIDDVLTSGHTASALARCLKHAGAADVQVWVVARAI